MPIPRSVYCQRVPEWKATGLGALSVLTAVSPFDGQTPDHETFKHSPSSPEEVEKFVNTSKSWNTVCEAFNTDIESISRLCLCSISLSSPVRRRSLLWNE
eukprot:Blabericola_migrator_1__6931@NODE_3510_length_1718_cov_47_504543_g2179_i0_p3_GENE_NODE_3510_length_1718_cov_47_504543_g2179_i0NODE_3510_length_1718_cov_47_504543_g2179_i0_p3_ORF_typecomplete_len100_score19_28_NODE_3510_length_1718_cov_47_504543_g2179_i0173472